MAVLSISSYVSRGYVGNRAISFALESLGEEVIALPTVIFSNHPGNSSYSGFSIQASDLAAFFEEFKTTNNINNLKLALHQLYLHLFFLIIELKYREISQLP